MFIDWFYDKTVDIYEYTDDNYDEHGVSRDGYVLKQEGIKVDIQPIGAEKVKQTYGYNIEVNYEMYTSNMLEESDIVVWNGKTYKIEKLIPWDDYTIALLLQENIKLNAPIV